MFKIRGRYATANVYATNIEQSAVAQILKMANAPFSEGQNIAIMPDVHAGAGCTIGTTMTVGDRVCPNVVGVDLGCGMLTADVGREELDLAHLDAKVRDVPSGASVWPTPREPFDLTELRCHDELRNVERLDRSMGTLGGGNHFVEVERAEDGTNRLVIHSGSRNLGLQVATHYQRLAISERRAAGDAKGTEDALCWLEGPTLEDYLHDVRVCQRFAKRNREVMMEVICRAAGLEPTRTFHTIHNYIDVDEMILRKGAIAAHEGELVLIPLNMRDGSVLARGRGNEEWNFSAPHGAGRLLSRSEAKELLDLDEYRQQMLDAGIYTTSVSASTLDEAPDAYKPMDDIIGPISESVDIVEVMRPIYNFKAH